MDYETRLKEANFNREVFTGLLGGLIVAISFIIRDSMFKSIGAGDTISEIIFLMVISIGMFLLFAILKPPISKYLAK